MVVAARHQNPRVFFFHIINIILQFTFPLFRFYRKTGFLGVIGCLDCTHIAIVPPSKNLNLNENRYPEYMYVNRKNYHSINIQLVRINNILNIFFLYTSPTRNKNSHKYYNLKIYIKHF
ncbi:putative nuclease HARBI1 isoform X2, partial [Aphis craccivora]